MAGSWLGSVKGYRILLGKQLEELCPGDRNILEKKEQIGISRVWRVKDKPGIAA